jgi:hypothetical protein
MGWNTNGLLPRYREDQKLKDPPIAARVNLASKLKPEGAEMEAVLSWKRIPGRANMAADHAPGNKPSQTLRRGFYFR